MHASPQVHMPVISIYTHPMVTQNSAMQSEFDALQAIHTRNLVSKIDDINLVSTKWAFKIKTKADESIEIYKARVL